jgi:acyl-ACP thioesterase
MVNKHLNNPRYMKAVYEALKQAKTREKAIEILQDIAEQISLTGNYP